MVNSKQRVRAGSNPVIFDGASRPEQNRFAHHIGFTMRTVTSVVPSRVFRFEDDSPLSPKPRAFRTKDMPLRNDIPTKIFESIDRKTEINGLHITQGKASHRLLSVDGDQVWFVHKGTGVCDTVLGRMLFNAPAYIFIPRSFTYRISAKTETVLIGMESVEPLLKPTFTWLNDTVPFSEHNLTTPEPTHSLHDKEDSRIATEHLPLEPVWKVWVKRARQWSTVLYSQTPFSCIGYQGHPYPFVLPFEHISLPTLSKEHTDPTAFMTFASPVDSRGMPSVGISTFLPHRVHSLPYYHTNLYDEILFLSEEYGPRGKVLHAGDMSFHPQGFPHGPQPEALKNCTGPARPGDAPYTNMRAVMFESQSPLMLAENIEFALVGNEINNYWESWRES